MQQYFLPENNTTFKDIIKSAYFFIKENYKFLLQIYLTIVGPVALISAFYKGKINFMLVKENMIISQEIVSQSLSFYFFAFLSFGLLVSCTLIYIKLYNSEIDKNSITVDMIWKLVWSKIWVILGASFISGLLISLGFLLFIVPGIWLAVPLFFVFHFIIFESKSFSEAFTEAFNIIKGNWFYSFIILFNFVLINFLLSLVILQPISFFNSGILDGTITDSSINYNFISILLNVVNTFVSGFTLIGGTILYYKLKSLSNTDSTFDRNNIF